MSNATTTALTIAMNDTAHGGAKESAFLSALSPVRTFTIRSCNMI